MKKVNKFPHLLKGEFKKQGGGKQNINNILKIKGIKHFCLKSFDNTCLTIRRLHEGY